MAEKANLEIIVLRDYLADFEPYQIDNYGNEYDADVVYMTSADIANNLSDMITLSLNDVAHEMLSRGFYIGQSPDQRTCWVMARKEV